MLAGVAWTPGLPGGGGGSGGNAGFLGRNPGYTLDVLPRRQADEEVRPMAIAEGGGWVTGHTFGADCQRPIAWKREANGWSTHVLPNLGEDVAGNVFAVTQQGHAVGRLSTSTPCSGAAGSSFLPVVWERIGEASWSVEALPSPFDGGQEGQAIDISWVPGFGSVIVGHTIDPEGVGRATLWHRAFDGGWVAIDLGAFVDISGAPAVNDQGVVLGWSDDPVLAGELSRPFLIMPVDVDRDGWPEWHRDDDGDGRNDLLAAPTERLPEFTNFPKINDSLEAVGWKTSSLDPALALLQVGLAGSERGLDSGGFESAAALDLSDSGQVVGGGRFVTAQGPQTHGLLWERLEDGAWRLQDLNDVTALPRPQQDLVGEARGVNDCGEIIALGEVDRLRSALVLTPDWSPCGGD